MNKLEIKKVPFMGAELMAARDNDGQIWAGVRWMCNGIGLSKGQRDRQILNIQSDEVLSEGASNLRLPTEGGPQEVLCLKLDFIPLWLAKIAITPSMKEEHPELAETLKQYQLKAKDVLAAAFMPDLYAVSLETPPTPARAQRVLTPDDYLRAATIVSNCRNERMPYVLGFLEQSGFSVREIEQRIECKEQDALPIEGHMVELLNRAYCECGINDRQIGELVGIGHMQIWRYRKGINAPRDIRRTEHIIRVVSDAIASSEN